MKEPYWNFQRIMEIENSFGLKSTFFFLNESIKFDLFNTKNWQLSLGRYDVQSKKIKDIIKYLDKHGWEIGLHGSYYSFNNYELLNKEKNTLEKIVGHEIIGTRQHYLNLDENTWQIQQKCGFKYDSSLGFTKEVGFRDGKIKPFHPSKNSFIVFPLAIMDVCLMKYKNKWDEFNKILAKVEKNDAVLVINWHQRVFNENEFPDYYKSYIRIIKELKNRNAQFVTLGQIYKSKDK